MKARQYKLLGIFLVLGAVLLNYQNCGSKGASSASVETADGGEMGIINPVIAGGINFTQSKAVVSASDTELAVDGLCSKEQSGALIGWQLRDDNANIVSAGRSLCDKGAFEVVFAGVQSLACGASMTLVATFGSKAKSEIAIEKNCQ
jgi:hypothetical protein